MKAVVALKQILDPRGFTVNRRAEKIFVNREEYIINPADMRALEAALRLKDVAGAEVIVLCGGPERAADALRQAWAMGADRGIHLADGLVAARILAAAVRKLGDVALALTGDYALDSGAGEVGPRLAEALGWPHIMAAHVIEIKDGVADVVAAVGKQFMAVEARLPAVVVVASSATQNGPRYANAARVINSYQKWQPEVWSAADLELSADALEPAVVKRGQAFPPERQLGTILSSAHELVGVLRRQRVI